MLSIEYTSDYISAIAISNNKPIVGDQTISSDAILTDTSMKFNVCAQYMNYVVPASTYGFAVTGLEIRVSNDQTFSTYETLTNDSLKVIGNINVFIKDLQNLTQNYLASVGIVGISEKYVKFVLTYTALASSNPSNNSSLVVWIEKLKHVSKV